MKVLNQKTMTCPFEEYLKLPGWSYSSLKNEGVKFTPTKKMQLGTNVHNYLLEPQKYNHENIEIVRPLAVALKKRVGILIELMKPEIAVTADFVHEGLVMPYKGRADLSIFGKLVIDFKITEMPLHKFIPYFGTDFQLSGYGMGFSSRACLVIAINPKNKLITSVNIPIQSGWWEQQIKMKGEAV